MRDRAAGQPGENQGATKRELARAEKKKPPGAPGGYV